MDCCGSIKRTPIIEALPIGVKSQRRGAQVSLVNIGFSNSSRKSNFHSQGILKVSGRSIYSRRSIRPLVVAVANAESREYKLSGVGTPLEPRSPEGLFLSGVLQNQRHLFPFAVSEQLNELASDRDSAVARKEQSSGSIESLLHRRIAEMKENECQVAIEDVMYMSIVHKFSEIKVPMVPKLSKCINDDRLEIWPSKCRELESFHSSEVQELIKEHLTTIMRLRGRYSTIVTSNTTKIDRLHLGRIYAASIVYGYFLKSACLRHELDTSIAYTHDNIQPLGHRNYLSVADLYPCGFNSIVTLGESTNTQATSLCQESRSDTRHEKLSSYVMGMGSESLQRCAKLKSKEAVNLIEKHTWALFGDEKIGELDSGSDIVITFPSLERLVLEAVAFGSFLWDVERSVDSAYGLQEN
ncbi:hypothetical protein IFM89_023648 [Coptis chinensis]|uniref:UV-B-induced protein At3g17800, chloroplastic n=1 Tax=Coptis chinensis TaxID=261450 RepID=A0A835HZF8_9MAGN|nr:hypothetical protein IFM89_023648 [Coptis chinensis]